MKKILLTIVLLLCIMFSMTACNSEKRAQKKMDKYATLEIEGNEYTLTGDFQEVVGTMVKNGLQVINHYAIGNVYNEEGKYAERDYSIDDEYVMAMEKIEDSEWKDGMLYSKVYIFRGHLMDFESAQGITSDSEEEDMKEVKNYIESPYVIRGNSSTYVTMFVEGKQVDFSDYEDDYEEWMANAKDDGYKPLQSIWYSCGNYSTNFGAAFKDDILKEIESTEDAEAILEEKGYNLKAIKLLDFASQDALKMMEEEKIDSYITIRYEFTEDGNVFMEYMEYCYDEDYQMKKFIE